MKTVKVVLVVSALLVSVFYLYGIYKRMKFDKNCIKNGGTIIESGYQCQN